MITVHPLGLDQLGRLDGFEERNVYQTAPWQNFLMETQKATPLFLELRDGDRVVGYFTGATRRTLGVKILASPMKGWTTEYMGFNLREGTTRREALEAVSSFAFNGLRCHYFEVVDRFLTEADVAGSAYTTRHYRTFEIDLAKSEADLFGAMESACRRCIRKAERSGVVIEEAAPDGFPEEYHRQLTDVFAKQSMAPTYGPARVRALVRHLYPTGNLLLLKAMSPEGTCIATGIFPGLGRTMYLWGVASLREHQHLRPNEPLIWHAMRYWKRRGVVRFDMGGGGAYKSKYGAGEVPICRVMRGRYPFILPARRLAEDAWKWKRRIGRYVRQKGVITGRR